APRDAAARRRADRPHLVGRDGVHRRPRADRRRDRPAARLPHARRDDGLHARAADGADARRAHVRFNRPAARVLARSRDRRLGDSMDRTHTAAWKGYWPACPTIFDDDENLDLETYAQLLEWYIGQGVHGLFVNGTTGEWFSQTPAERRSVVETAVAVAAGRVPVIAGCTAYTAREVAELGSHALETGAVGFSSTPPPYSKTLPDETVRFFEDVSDRVQGPILIYNWPHGCSVDIDADLADRLADVPNVAGIKDSTPNAQQFYE